MINRLRRTGQSDRRRREAQGNTATLPIVIYTTNGPGIFTHTATLLHGSIRGDSIRTLTRLRRRQNSVTGLSNLPTRASATDYRLTCRNKRVVARGATTYPRSTASRTGRLVRLFALLFMNFRIFNTLRICLAVVPVFSKTITRFSCVLLFTITHRHQCRVITQETTKESADICKNCSDTLPDNV